MATKRDKQRFVKAATELLKARGARPSTVLSGCYEWELDTPSGLVLFSVQECTVKEFLGGVFGRFDKVEMGKAFGCNPYSGKWNHDYFDVTVEDALRDLDYQLRRLFKQEWKTCVESSASLG